MAAVQDVDPATLHSWLERGEAVLVDVRENDDGGRIAGAHVVPYSRLEPGALPEVGSGQRLVLHCAVGVRSRQGGQELLAAGVEPVYHLAGGINAWRRAGVSDRTERSTDRPKTPVLASTRCRAGAKRPPKNTSTASPS